jgi:hypothetical protein
LFIQSHAKCKTAAATLTSMRALTKIITFLADLRSGCSFYRVPYLSALLRSLWLYLISRFSRKEIIGYGLFVPALVAEMPLLISKDRSLARLARINPPAFQHLTENKDEFYRICSDHRLPIPKTYGWTIDGCPYDASGRAIEAKRGWAHYLSDRLPEEFIVKDRSGAYGSGFRAFRRAGGLFHSAEGDDVYDGAGLARLLGLPGSDTESIVQKRLFDAAPLTALSGRRGLQTMRINTLQHGGHVSILFYMIKILAGQTASDNFSMGTTGNLIAYGDPDDGVLRGAVGLSECGCGMKRVAVHPGTGVSLDGFRLPHWHEAIDLAKTAQRCFPTLPTLGWDIALTEEGPQIIEANARWDPPLYAPFLMSPENWGRIFGPGESGLP